jgi:NADH:ubiquinone oxidoreductase subunit F (NADH-binding)
MNFAPALAAPEVWTGRPAARERRQVSRVPRLLSGLAPGQRADLNGHERCYGPLPLPPEAWSARGGAKRKAAARLIDTVERSGLTGRGGAGFPAARKLRSVAEAPGRAVLVANGGEGEPASRKDRLLLARLPHLVLDGISLAAFAVGADEAYLAVHGADTRLIASLEAAAQAREVAQIDPVPVRVTGLESRYVASEQSAVVQHLNGGPGLPAFSPPSVRERGVASRPTAVCNVETLAHLALIARYGSGWFREAGLPSAPGTTLVTISGEVARPGVYEIELGSLIGEVVKLAGGPVGRPQAVLTGGYFGAWLPVDLAWPAPMTHRALQSAGGALGAGILAVLGESSCGLAETARVVRYLAGETAGQCGPCVFGLPSLADAVADLAYHGGRRQAAGQITSLIRLIEGRGACRHPDGATQLAASALTAFAEDTARHDRHAPCYGVGRPPVLPIPGEEDW